MLFPLPTPFYPTIVSNEEKNPSPHLGHHLRAFESEMIEALLGKKEVGV
jgi:hypothetical protein